MEFNLRTLMYTDIMPMFNILSKVGFKDLKNKITPEMLKGDTNQIGFVILMALSESVLDNVQVCEEDLIAFMSSVAQMEPDQIRGMTMVEFTELFVAILQKDDFKDFFKVVSKLFK